MAQLTEGETVAQLTEGETETVVTTIFDAMAAAFAKGEKIELGGSAASASDTFRWRSPNSAGTCFAKHGIEHAIRLHLEASFIEPAASTASRGHLPMAGMLGPEVAWVNKRWPHLCQRGKSFAARLPAPTTRPLVPSPVPRFPRVARYVHEPHAAMLTNAARLIGLVLGAALLIELAAVAGRHARRRNLRRWLRDRHKALNFGIH